MKMTIMPIDDDSDIDGDNDVNENPKNKSEASSKRIEISYALDSVVEQIINLEMATADCTHRNGKADDISLILENSATNPPSETTTSTSTVSCTRRRCYSNDQHSNSHSSQQICAKIIHAPIGISS
ncbi:hypothetical protein EVAR_100761_1 [Eumeta japonica]|uniref:Uncharacterized protein n=1 Tax=Eumeta variegata TaxID=151549 RepID=A0A4C1SEI2_EUMVA|nr:hypothetical protein EVAR_100761_1 [Eumeta japonica]